MSLSQQVIAASEAFVASTCVPQSSHSYRLPSWIVTVIPPFGLCAIHALRNVLLFLRHLLAVAGQGPIAALCDDDFHAAGCAPVSLTHLIRHCFDLTSRCSYYPTILILGLAQGAC